MQDSVRNHGPGRREIGHGNLAERSDGRITIQSFWQASFCDAHFVGYIFYSHALFAGYILDVHVSLRLSMLQR